MLNATRYVGGTVLTIGIAIFLYGFFVSDYSTVTGIGIGTVMGAVFIFLMGCFLVAYRRNDWIKRHKGIDVIKKESA